MTFPSFESVTIVMMRTTSSCQMSPLVVRFSESKLEKRYGRFPWTHFHDYYLLRFHFEFFFSCISNVVSDSTPLCFRRSIKPAFIQTENILRKWTTVSITIRCISEHITFRQCFFIYRFWPSRRPILPFCSISLGTRQFKPPSNRKKTNRSTKWQHIHQFVVAWFHQLILINCFQQI